MPAAASGVIRGLPAVFRREHRLGAGAARPGKLGRRELPSHCPREPIVNSRAHRPPLSVVVDLPCFFLIGTGYVSDGHFAFEKGQTPSIPCESSKNLFASRGLTPSTLSRLPQ